MILVYSICYIDLSEFRMFQVELMKMKPASFVL